MLLQPGKAVATPEADSASTGLFQAGATSMWASCCGLLNEVMGTGAVRSQQPGFGSGANPFRFAPSTDFTVYSSAATAGANAALCKSCGLSFSVFRKKVSVLRPPRWALLGHVGRQQKMESGTLETPVAGGGGPSLGSNLGPKLPGLRSFSRDA